MKLNAVSEVIRDNFMAEQDRWFLWLPVFIGLGVSAYFFLDQEPSIWAGLIGLISLSFIPIIGRRNYYTLIPSLALIGIAVGFTAAQWRTISVAHPVLEKRTGPVTASGQIVRVEAQPKSTRVTLQNARLSGVEPPLTPDQIRVTLRGLQPPMKAGDWIKVRAVLTPPPAPVMPGGFDFQRRFYFMEIGATGFGMGRAIILEPPTNMIPGSGIREYVENLRQTITARVRHYLPENNGTVAAALMTGDRSAISKDVIEAFRDSGLAHLLAISGLHIGLIAGLLLFIFRAGLALIPPLALSFPIKKWAALVAILGSFCYAVVAGATIPTQRAFLMIALVLFAVITDRRGISMRMVAIAATIILLLKPESLLGASFQLSFAAVVALIAVYEYLRDRHKFTERERWVGKPARYIGGIALTTFVAGMATAPFALFHFNQMAQFSLFANILAVPLTALIIMPCAILSFVLMPLGLESIGLAPMGWGVDGVISIAKTVAAWDGAVISAPKFSMAGLAFVSVGGIWLCFWRRNWRFGGALAIAMGLSSLMIQNPPDILVDEKGKLFAVTDESGKLVLSSRRQSKFSGNNWLRLVGQNATDPPIFPISGYSSDGLISCDLVGCIYRKQGRKIAIIKDSRALAEDCRQADIIVSGVPVRGRCPSATLIIDRFDLWRNGAHAIRLKNEQIQVESVNAVRGRRPWVHRPRKKTLKK